MRTPFSRERQRLVRLIEQHGSVEFIQDAFLDPDTQRKTDVEVALVHLVKVANYQEDIIGTLLDDMRRDSMTAAGLMGDYREMNEVALPASFIENSVLVFNAAVSAMKDAIKAEARANHYSALIGKTLAEMGGEGSAAKRPNVDFVRTQIGKCYDDLKDRAWSNVLRSTEVLDRLSSSAQKRLESEFESIKRMEFTEAGIRGFLLGLVEKQGDIQIGMACDVFDLITTYYTDNTVYYRGWKSNDKHRTMGIRIKGTRFVLPGHKAENWRDSASWDTMQMLRDFDKVFRMLDGKAAPGVGPDGRPEADFGLAHLFETQFGELKQAKRMSTDYFDVRYFKGIGTIHFYPRGTKLMDRLNRLVGRHREWLPPEGERVPEAFWLQFDQSEKLDAEFRAEVAKQRLSACRDPLWHLSRKHHDDERAQAEAGMDAVMTAVQERHGIRLDALEAPRQTPLLLAA